MNAKEAAWSALVDHFCKIPPRKRDWEWVVEAKDLTEAYAAAAVAEARAPLVEALEAVDALLGEYAESNAFGKERCISRIATIIGTAVFALKGETP